MKIRPNWRTIFSNSKRDLVGALAAALLVFGVQYYRGKKLDWEEEKQKMQTEVNEVEIYNF